MQISGSPADTSGETSAIDELEAFFHRMPVAFYRTDVEGELIAANAALAHLLGYETVKDLKRALPSVETVYTHPERRAEWLERISTEGVIQDFDVELRRRDGSTVWVRDAARVISGDSGGNLYYEGALIDVTDKIEAQRERDEFVATISHELRNPLAAMLGLSSELAEHYASFSDEERREMAQVVARQAEDASWIIEDLLVVYRHDMDKLDIAIEKVDVAEEVERVLEVLDRPVPVIGAGELWMVWADPRRLRQILRNLVSNAERYGGDRIRVRLCHGTESVEIRVEDSGPEIPESEVARIFRPYERGRGRRHPGSVGLGLSVARRLARLMGGELAYRHQEGWSAFVLSLPSA